MKRYPFTIITAILLVLFPGVHSVTLADYPKPMFIDSQGKFNGIIIIGDYSAVEDIVGAISILGSLQRSAVKSITTNSVRVETPVPIPSSAVKLASEVEDISENNAIIVGGPCINPSASWLLNYPQPCYEGFKTGTGYIRFIEHPNGRNYMLVAGRSAIDTRRAAHVVSNYEDFNLLGFEEQVTKYTVDDIKLKSDSNI